MVKTKIRRNVFESNSSSSHSLTVNKCGSTGKLEVDEYENKVITHFGEFGWGYDTYTDPETKLSYLVTMLIETNCDCFSIEELCETDDFKAINDVVAEHCECSGILIDEEITKKSWGDWADHEGYIDHQSVMNITKLLNNYDCTIEEFIFDPGIELIIDNDNHQEKNK